MNSTESQSSSFIIFGLFIPSIYNILSIMAYAVLLFVITKERKQLSKSFYVIFMFQSVTNLITCVNAFFAVRLLQFIQADSNVAEFYFQLPKFFCLMSSWLIVHCAFVQFLFIFIISLNRYSILIIPAYHDKVWAHTKWLWIIAALVCPFGCTYVYFFADGHYGPALATNRPGINLYNSVNGLAVYQQILYTMFFFMPLTVGLNLLTFYSAYGKMKSKTFLEAKLFSISLINAIIMSISIGFLVIMVYGSSWGDIYYAAKISLPYVSDLMNLNTPFVYFAVSPNSRKMVRELFCKRQMKIFKIFEAFRFRFTASLLTAPVLLILPLQLGLIVFKDETEVINIQIMTKWVDKLSRASNAPAENKYKLPFLRRMSCIK